MAAIATRVIQPQPGPQTQFLQTKADIAVYGGSAGGGKTYGLLLEACRHTGTPGFGAVIFRRTSEQVRTQGGLWDESTELYPLLGAKPREHTLEWKFPSGADVRFEHLQHDKDKLQYQGAQICMMGFDELTHFLESQFFYMLSRNRSVCGIRPYLRATCNPDANSWVKVFLAPWLDADYPDPAESGEIRWFIREGDNVVWVPEGTEDAKSVTFIRATIYDNQILLKKDPGYLASLKAMTFVDRRRLLDGDWDIVEGGNMFRREWFEIIPEAPVELVSKVRFWDMAATEVKPGKDPDWTVGVLMGKDKDNLVYVLDVQRVRATPLNTEKLVRQMAEIDGKGTAIRMEQEGGSSGITVIGDYTRKLMGWNFKGEVAKINKAERAKPFSSYAEAGNVKLVKGLWNNTYLNELAPFPNPDVHDDQVDGSSGAFDFLSVPKPKFPIMDLIY